MAPALVKTARLMLTRPQRGDLDELTALLGDPRVARWLGGTPDRAAVRSMIEQWSAHWDVHGFGLWSARDRESGALVGRGGLRLTVAGGAGLVEVGWTVAADRWGEGLATEIGRAGTALAADELGIEEVCSFTLADNDASRAVMGRLGLRYERDITYAGLPHVLYRSGSTTPGPAAAPAA